MYLCICYHRLGYTIHSSVHLVADVALLAFTIACGG
jgi:hypothetical protein